LICLSFVIQISSAVTMSVTRLSTASVLLMTMLIMLMQRQTHGLGKMIQCVHIAINCWTLGIH